METSTPVRPSGRAGTLAPAGTLYLPFGTLPVGAPPACFAMEHLLATGVAYLRMALDAATQPRAATESGLRLQAIVFCLVAAAFTAVYITQPVLPVLQVEFGVNESVASLTISSVILGIALANLPFGVLADRYPIRPLLIG